METYMMQAARRAQEQIGVWEVPGLALGAVQDGKVLLCTGFGARDEAGEPFDGRTLFHIGSCSKAFTALCAEILAERGLLDLDAPIRRYMPDFALCDEYAGRSVTARDLLCHRSGLPRHEYAWYGTDFTREELVHNLRYLKPNQTIRQGFQYNNLGYIVVGVLIERLTGKTWERFVTDEVFGPLQMDRTTVYIDDAVADGNYAQPFDRPSPYVSKGYKRMPFYRSPAEDRAAERGLPCGPAGSILSCAEDMLKWAAFQMGDGTVQSGVRLLSAQRMEEMHKPLMLMEGGVQVPGRLYNYYGLGWRTFLYHGKKVICHNGAIDGSTTALYLIPELRLAAVANVNMTNNLLCEAAVNDLIDRCLGVEFDQYALYREANAQMFAAVKEYVDQLCGARVPDTVPSHPLSDYGGTYRTPGYNDIVITEADGALVLHFNGWDVPFAHFHYDVFRLEGCLGELTPGVPVQFFAGADGGINRLSIPLVTDPGAEPVCFRKV